MHLIGRVCRGREKLKWYIKSETPPNKAADLTVTSRIYHSLISIWKLANLWSHDAHALAYEECAEID